MNLFIENIVAKQLDKQKIWQRQLEGLKLKKLSDVEARRGVKISLGYKKTSEKVEATEGESDGTN